MCSPTRGTVNVCGYDMIQNTAEARAYLSFCQQQDVFFPDLTVWEHLAYFGALKGIDRSSLSGRITESLKVVRLEDKARCLTSVLSGGMKKRLSIAMATISKPKVVILDEPTSGLDPETRREMWDLFRSMRYESTLLISTHDMAEADILGDRVVVLAQGAVQCSGSPGFLKKAYGAGYRVQIARKPSVAFQLYDIMHIIKSTVPEAEVRRHRQSEVTVALHVLDCAGFEHMFAQLEAQSDALGIDSIGVSVATIQDVFVKINREETQLLSRTATLADYDVTWRAATTEGAGNSCGASLASLLVKRTLCLYRSLAAPLTAWLLPLLVFWALMALECGLLPEPTRRLRRLAVPLSLGAAYRRAATFVHAGDELRSVARDVVLPLLEEQGTRADVLADPAGQLAAMAAQHFYAYTQEYAFGISVTRRMVELTSENESTTVHGVADLVLCTQGHYSRRPFAYFTGGLAVHAGATVQPVRERDQGATHGLGQQGVPACPPEPRLLGAALRRLLAGGRRALRRRDGPLLHACQREQLAAIEPNHARRERGGLRAPCHADGGCVAVLRARLLGLGTQLRPHFQHMFAATVSQGVTGIITFKV
ncbi:ABC transporter A family member 5-like isoform X2 [Dermacentor andersoni]|uniref:ABC transporter A family member 5-like isoform X2 n=1 Tax=Dermacentor andersoni TaxID=34620 RepID=UPI0024159C84|nr:phospholipid-transporting ATPase ABCA3-like isoform X2 [Dermacentor andersoni]